MQLKIVSFNIWDLPLFFVPNRKARIAALPAYLKELDADIICLQESFDPKHRAFLRESLTPEYFMAGGDARQERRLLFIKLFDSTGGLAIFSKYPILKSKFVPHSRFRNFALGELFGRKGCLTATVRTPRGDIEILNTHLHEETVFQLDRRVRRHQLGQILKRANSTSLPALLVGDLNQDALNHQEDFAELFAAQGFDHPLHPYQDHIKPTYRLENPYVDRWHNRTHAPRRFDYILVRNLAALGLRAIHYEPQKLVPPLSDHDPVVLTLASADKAN